MVDEQKISAFIENINDIQVELAAIMTDSIIIGYYGQITVYIENDNEIEDTLMNLFDDSKTNLTHEGYMVEHNDTVWLLSIRNSKTTNALTRAKIEPLEDLSRDIKNLRTYLPNAHTEILAQPSGIAVFIHCDSAKVGNDYRNAFTKYIKNREQDIIGGSARDDIRFYTDSDAIVIINIFDQ